MHFGKKIPLAERLRPKTLDDVIGQKHLVGEDGVLRKMIAVGNLPSIIFWGPPGVGKTTLAEILAQSMKTSFFTLSAISSGVKDVREVIQKARSIGKVILFIDEIHRFNKSQQDALLGAVERGFVTLIGATTENPSFEVNSALLSRCQVYTLNGHTEEELLLFVEKALREKELTKDKKVVVKETDAILRLSSGDGRKIYNLLEVVIESQPEGEIEITNKLVESIIHQNLAKYDKGGDMHYDVISAFIKSIRGSDPNATIYWLARMLDAGEDIKFIARRMIISASEDIGLANPTAMVMANNCFQSINVVGMPEARIILSQTAIYLAMSPKSNAAYMAINLAMGEVNNSGDLSVPLPLRGAYTSLNKDLGYGKGYKYSHDYPGGFVQQEFMPPELSNHSFYQPKDIGRENDMKTKLDNLWGEKYKDK